MAFWLTLVVLYARGGSATTPTSLPFAIVGFLSSAATISLSYMEHKKSLKPSLLLNVYLLISVLFDIAHCRTLFLLRDDTRIAAVFAGALGSKVILLFLEAKSKRSYLQVTYRSLPTESTIGLFNLAFFWWLNETFFRGFRTLLSSGDLQEIDRDLKSEKLGQKLQRSWDARALPDGPHTLVRVVGRTFWRPLFLPVTARLCLIGFKFAQPFLITSLMDLLSEPSDSRAKDKGYGLVGGAAIVYLGLAISNGIYKHQLFRCITIFRGALISLIFNRIFTVQVGVYNESSALSLMGMDTESICLSIENTHETWAQLIEVILGSALLGRQLGWVCVWPLVVVAVSTVGSSIIAQVMPKHQKIWAAAVQIRIATTASCISSMKAVRMIGFSRTMTIIIQGLRIRELKFQASFRWLILWLNSIANIPKAFAPPVTFIAFAIQAKARGSDSLNLTQAFTSLALIVLVSGPAQGFLSAVPTVAASLGCFERVQEYLLSASREDARRSLTEARSATSSSYANSQSEISSIPLQILRRNLSAEMQQLAISMRNADIRPSNTSIFSHKNVNLDISKGSINIVVGPIGSGKTVLAKALLGEVPCEAGSILIAERSMGYCSQVPWLLNSTIQENICGMLNQQAAIDETWYQTVVRACALEVDIRSFPEGDQTMIGTKGLTLSGGQKQRLALARCVYARRDIVVLDDVLSALDARTEQTVVDRLLGESGLFRQLGTTVLLVTHSVGHFRLADKIVVLGPQGSVARQGSFENLSSELENLDLVVHSGLASEDEISQVQMENLHAVVPTQTTSSLDNARQTGDSSTYKYYASFIGWYKGLSLLLFILGYIFSLLFPQVWLMWWVEAGGSHITKYTVVYAAFGFLQLAIQFLALWSVLVWIAPSTAAKLHWVVLQTTMKARQSFFSETDIGVTLNRFSQDMTLVEQSLPQAAMTTLAMVFTVLGQLSLISLGSSYMAITIPFIFVVLYFLQFFYLRTSRQVRLLDLETKSPVYSHFLETLEGIATIRAFGWQERFKVISISRLDTSQTPYYLMFCIQRWLNLVLDLIVGVIAVLVIALAVSIRTSTTSSRIGISLNNVLGLSMYLSMLINSWTEMETSLGAIARIKSFAAQTQPEEQPGETQIPPEDWPQRGEIEIRKIRARYKCVTLIIFAYFLTASRTTSLALQNITMLIKPGQKIGICGRTGSGKSSLLSALLCLLDIESGTITIDGIDLRTVRRDILRERLIAIPQDPFILTGTVRLNLDPSSQHSSSSLISALTKVHLWAVIENRGGLECELNEHPLSQGQQQLFSLARAMLRRSKILILDEATSNVDAETDALMQRVIRDEFAGYTIVTVAHRLDTIMDADRVAVLEGGRLVEFGEPQVLLGRDSAFKRLHGI
ncbi:putative multidrug resistance protein [Stipitochalara longipes BDJ]|nr:putative multidrug resistance protein [Stipitochalara longipes BDJ]